jgi:phosphoglycerol transferase
MKIAKNIFAYLLAPLLAVIAFFAYFQLWQFNLNEPIFSYSQDGLFYLFAVKLTMQEGWFFTSKFLGYPQLDGVFNLNDFPIQADSFNFLLIKFFAIFSNNAIFVVNCYFILTFALNSLAAFVAFRAFKINNLSAILLSILFAFLPYHFVRSSWHLFLSNYAVIPLLVICALWICQGKINLIGKNAKNQISFSPNYYFFISLSIVIFAASNGIYYIFYGLIIFIFAWFLKSLDEGKFINNSLAIIVFLGFATFVTLFILYFPSFSYWIKNGANAEVANRSYHNSEYFALRLVDLLMPIQNHFIAFLANLRIAFDEALGVEGERRAASLGILIASAFLFLLIWVLTLKESKLFQKTISFLKLNNDEEKLINDLSRLNLLSLLFASVGGLVILLVMSFPLIRSHARFCLFIAFFALMLLAIIFNKISQKNLFAKIALILISILAFFDQVGPSKPLQQKAQKEINIFRNDKNFVEKVENSKAKQIFILPVFGFPESAGDEYQALRIYVNSKNLKLSYPAIKGRKANLWQEEVKNLPFEKFIFELKKAGFDSIIINRSHFADDKSEKKSWQKLRILENNLKKLRKDSIVSADLNWIFYKL